MKSPFEIIKDFFFLQKYSNVFMGNGEVYTLQRSDMKEIISLLEYGI